MSQDAETEAPATASPASTSVYVYGVIRGGAGQLGREITGVGTEPAPVRAVDAEGLAALVSDVPSDWHAATRKDVEAHDGVLAQLMGGHTVVPMRFGIVLASDVAVREQLLESHSDELRALLERVNGREQMSVKAFYVDEALLRAVLARRPELKARADALEALPATHSQGERIALGREVAEAVEEQRRLDQQAMLDALTDFADEVEVEPSMSERHVATVHLLVARERRTQLDAAVQRLADAHQERFALRYVGPLPPYSFCAMALDAEPQPWA